MRRINYISIKDLGYKSIRDFRPAFYFMLVANLVLVTLIMYPQKIKTLVRYRTVERLVEDMPLTDSAIVSELTMMGCVLPNVALAQFKVETAHFSSPICKENKNIGGIRTSSSRYVKGMNRGHCVYNTYRDCLRDYIRIQNRYLGNIDNKYAEAKDYTKILRQIK